MENKIKAVYEQLGYVLKPEIAKKFFFNVYEFLLYNDTEGFLKTLEYRMDLDSAAKADEDYLVFKFMLQYILIKHPKKVVMLHPELIHIPHSDATVTAFLSISVPRSRDLALGLIA